MPIDYRKHRDKKIIVLKRDWSTVKKGEIPKTNTCPFCDLQHNHGDGEGHRVSHCTNNSRNVIDEYGNVFSSSDGYFIIDVNK